MRPAFVAHGALGNDVLSPWRMLLMAIQAGYSSLVLASIAGYCCRFILVAFHAICHFKRNPFRFNLMGKNRQHEGTYDRQTYNTKQIKLFLSHHFYHPFLLQEY